MTQGPIGDIYGDYRIIGVIGEGGMGTVYKARHRDEDMGPDAKAAIKVIHPDFATIPELRQRFKIEARIMYQLGLDPNVVNILQHGESGGPNNDRLFIAMHFIPGENLRERLRRLSANNAWLSLAEAIALIKQLCSPLRNAHSHGIRHSDLKPENIMLLDDEAQEFGYRLILMDFGIAGLREVTDQIDPNSPMGTRQYMSPEQTRYCHKEIDHRTDIYSLGIMLFELVTGQTPFQINSREEIRKHCEETPPKPSSIYPDVPDQVEEIILKAIEKDPNDRFSTIDELCQALNQIDLSLKSVPSLSSVGHQTVRLSMVDQLPQLSRPLIQNYNQLEVQPEVKAVLKKMFPSEQYAEVSIRRQFNEGRSGAYVFDARPFREDEVAEAHSAIKIAAYSLIRKEHDSYSQYIKRLQDETKQSLNSVTHIGTLTELADYDLGWGGLRYSLTGGGDERAISLYEFYRQEDTDRSLDKQRALFEQMRRLWNPPAVFIDRKAMGADYSIRKHFSHLLPMDLLITCPGKLSKTAKPVEVRADGAWSEISSGDPVRVVKGQFEVVKVDLLNRTITLRSPASESSCYNLRLKFESREVFREHSRYKIGELLPVSIEGVVSETRSGKFQQIFDSTLDSHTDWRQSWWLAHPSLKAPLPNPWLCLNEVLKRFLNDTRSGIIHGDLNLENVLIERPGDALYLIDFAEVRQDRVLHDLFRYETEIVVKIFARTLANRQNATVPKAVYDFYSRLDRESFKLGKDPVAADSSPEIEKSFKMLVELRKEAQSNLTGREEQYYLGLMVYLLGAMKFDTLNEPRDKLGRSIPKQVSFWAAATIAQWARLDLPPPPPLPKAFPLWLWVAGIFAIASVGLFAVIVWGPGEITPAPSPPSTATVFSSPSPAPSSPAENPIFAPTFTSTFALTPTVAPIRLDEHAVTNGQYQTCVETGVCEEPKVGIRPASPSYKDPAKVNDPVVNITWIEAYTYCVGYRNSRLPTVEEWDLAAGSLDLSDNIQEWVVQSVDDTPDPLNNLQRPIKGNTLDPADDKDAFREDGARNNLGFRCVAP